MPAVCKSPGAALATAGVVEASPGIIVPAFSPPNAGAALAKIVGESAVPAAPRTVGAAAAKLALAGRTEVIPPRAFKPRPPRIPEVAAFVPRRAPALIPVANALPAAAVAAVAPAAAGAAAASAGKKAIISPQCQLREV